MLRGRSVSVALAPPPSTPLSSTLIHTLHCSHALIHNWCLLWADAVWPGTRAAAKFMEDKRSRMVQQVFSLLFSLETLGFSQNKVFLITSCTIACKTSNTFCCLAILMEGKLHQWLCISAVLDISNRTVLIISRLTEQCCIFLLCFHALRIWCSLAHLTTVWEVFSKCELSVSKKNKMHQTENRVKQTINR